MCLLQAEAGGVRECRQVREVRFIDGQVTNADHPPALKMDTGCVCYTRKGSGCCIDHKCRLRLRFVYLYKCCSVCCSIARCMRCTISGNKALATVDGQLVKLLPPPPPPTKWPLQWPTKPPPTPTSKSKKVLSMNRPFTHVFASRSCVFRVGSRGGGLEFDRGPSRIPPRHTPAPFWS